MLEIRQLKVSRSGCQVLAAMDFHVSDGELVGVVGPNGVGKSSLLRTLVGLEPGASGEIVWQGQPLLALGARQRAQMIGFLPQQEVPAWSLGVEHVVGLGRSPWRGSLERESSRDRDAIERAIAMTELQGLRHRTVDHLSGGELRRVLLARVLAGEPQCLIADEPIAALDPYHQLQVMEILQQHCRAGGSAVVAIHDLTLAARFCDRILLLGQGQLVAAGTPEQVLTVAQLEQVYAVEILRAETPHGVILQPLRRLPHRAGT